MAERPEDTASTRVRALHGLPLKQRPGWWESLPAFQKVVAAGVAMTCLGGTTTAAGWKLLDAKADVARVAPLELRVTRVEQQGAVSDAMQRVQVEQTVFLRDLVIKDQLRHGHQVPLPPEIVMPTPLPPEPIATPGAP